VSIFRPSPSPHSQKSDSSADRRDRVAGRDRGRGDVVKGFDSIALSLDA
jgi:hypothetical protein